MEKLFWSDVLGRVTRATTREIGRKTSQYGQRTVTRVTTEIEEQPYVLLSCGHAVRGADFDCRGKDRKRVQCYDCWSAARKAAGETLPGGIELP